jgi:hypothetical protein
MVQPSDNTRESQSVHHTLTPQDNDNHGAVKEGLGALRDVWRRRAAHHVHDGSPPKTMTRIGARRYQGLYDSADAISSEDKKEMRESRNDGRVESQGTSTTAKSSYSSLNDKDKPSKTGSPQAPYRNEIIDLIQKRLIEKKETDAESKSDDNVVSQENSDGQTMRERVSSLRIGGRTAWVKPSVEDLLKPLSNYSCSVSLGEISNKSNGSTAVQAAPPATQPQAIGEVVIAEEEKNDMEDSVPSKTPPPSFPDRNKIIEAMQIRLIEEKQRREAESKRVSQEKADGQTMRGRVSSFRNGGRKTWSRVKPSVQGLLKPLNRCYNKSNSGREPRARVRTPSQCYSIAEESYFVNQERLTESSSVIRKRLSSNMEGQEPWLKVNPVLRSFVKQLNCGGSSVIPDFCEWPCRIPSYEDEETTYFDEDDYRITSYETGETTYIEEDTSISEDTTKNIIKTMPKRLPSNMEGQKPTTGFCETFQLFPVLEDNFHRSGGSSITTDIFDGIFSNESVETTYIEEDDSMYQRSGSFSTVTY